MTKVPPESSRRGFLKATAVATTTSVFRPMFTIAEESGKGANERIGVGFIGVGSRCQEHINIVNSLKSQGDCEPVAVCDTYAPRAQAAAEKTGGKIYRDFRELLADPRVDVVCIATPDRHHAHQAIEAVRAGKDVYCEKPLTHWSQFALARQLEDEAEKHKRIVQVGTQFVADDAYAVVRKLIADGMVGRIVHAQAGYFRNNDWGERMPIPDPNAQPGPDLDWGQFLGDAPKVDFSVSRFFQWRMYWDYAGGPATDLLVHTFTPIACILDLDFPERVLGGGGTFQYQREVPDQCNILIDYAGGPSVALMSSLSNHVGTKHILRGTDGVIEFHAGDRVSPGIRVVPFNRNERKEILIPWQGMGDTAKMWVNFLHCIKSREAPYCPVSLGMRVQTPLLMGVLSHHENKVVRFDKVKKEIIL